MTTAAARLCPPTPPLHTEDPALPAIRADVVARIARVCADMPSDELACLVDQIARFKRRWALREAATPPS